MYGLLKFGYCSPSPLLGSPTQRHPVWLVYPEALSQDGELPSSINDSSGLVEHGRQSVEYVPALCSFAIFGKQYTFFWPLCMLMTGILTIVFADLSLAFFLRANFCNALKALHPT